MYENSNQSVLKELTSDNYRSHKTRNRLAILAIALTTILISAVLTVGISVTYTVMNYGEAAPGPGSIGSIIGDEAACEKIRDLPNVVHADYIEKCSSSPLRNDEFAGMSVYLMAAQQSYYDHNYVTLEDGRFPENPQEIILSDNMIEKLSLREPVIGSQVTLDVVIQENGQAKEKAFPFTVSGYFKNPLITLEDTYDEIYTSLDFVPAYNPETDDYDQEIYVSVDDLNPLLLKTDVAAKLSEISDAVGAGGYSTKHTSTMGDLMYGILPAGCFVLFIILSGYFLIYNVFYLSIAADIRWFGMLKTVGTTAKQLKKILMAQIRRLSAWGICIGTVIGYVVGDYLAPGVMSETIYSAFYKSPNFFVIFCLGALFSWITVYISAHRSLRMAVRISPVEAAKFVPKKRKNLFTILSFALSGIMFMVAANVTLGYSVERMVERYNMDDMYLLHKSFMWSLEEPYQPISQKTVDEIAGLPFVESTDVIYAGRSGEYSIDLADGSVYYDGSSAEFKQTGKIADMAKQMKEDGNLFEKDFVEEHDSVKLSVCGLSAKRLLRQAPYLEILEGSLDGDKFASGDFIVWLLQGNEEIHEGDQLELSVYDSENDVWHTKNVTVLAVAKSTDIFGTDDLANSSMALSMAAFKELFPDYENMIGKIQIQTRGEITQKERDEIAAVYEKEHSTQITAGDRYTTRESFVAQKRTMVLIGMFLSALFGIIGISNVINTITSDVFSRKIELAAMQSIGMTKKQLWKMLFGDSMRFSLAAVAAMIPVGSVLSYFIARTPLFTGFNLSICAISIVSLAAAVLLLCACMSTILVRVLNQKSVVERLREIE